MYTLFIKESNTPIEVHSMQKKVYSYHATESLPEFLEKRFEEVFKNGETRIIDSGATDDPDTTHFETFEIIENVSATVWGFKQIENSQKTIIIFSDLPRSMLNEELHMMINNMPDDKRKEIF